MVSMVKIHGGGEGRDYEKEDQYYKNSIYHLTILQECICVFFLKAAEEVEGYNEQRRWKYLNLS